MPDPIVRAGCRFRRGASLCLGLAGLLLAPHVAAAQAEPAKPPAVRPIVEFGDRGLVFNAADGFSYLALRFRVQEVAGLTTNSDNDLDVDSTQLVVRRARLRLESVAWDPWLRMSVQLAFSRGDMDFDAAGGPDVVRDAVLSFQATPRLSIAAGISHNDRAVRTGGQLGPALFAPRGMTTTLVDVLYKYHGWSISGEVARRTSPDPITTSGATTRYITVGGGVTAQASYLFANNLEPAVRYSEVRPESVLAGLAGADRQREVSLGLTAYLKEHKVKWQWELLHDDFRNAATAATRGSWGLMTSFEFGI